MSKSKIEWTEHTWNPVTGCTRVSAGCDNCYAVKRTYRLERMGLTEKYGGLTVLNGNGDRHFNGVVKCHEDALSIPLKRNKPTTYFVNSMSDLFHDGVPFEFVDRIFAVLALGPQHTFQVLTKRPERMAEYVARFADNHSHLTRFGCWASDMANVACDSGWRKYEYDSELRPGDDDYDTTDHVYDELRDAFGDDGVLPNVWLGTSIEDQTTADERIPHLLKCSAAVRFLSVEPLLGPIDLCNVGRNKEVAYGWWDVLRGEATDGLNRDTIEPLGTWPVNWVIVGGESGPKARPMHPDWARSIRDQCIAAGVPFFMKQICDERGRKVPWDQWPKDLQVREMPERTDQGTKELREETGPAPSAPRPLDPLNPLPLTNPRRDNQ